MADTQNSVGVGTSSLLLVLHDCPDEGAARRAIGQAEQTLGRLALDYEILVIGEGGAGEESGGRVRYAPPVGFGGYAGAIEAALAGPRYSHVVLSNGAADLAALSYLLPLAEQYPVVCGFRGERHGSLSARLIDRGFGVLTHLLLHPAARDGGGAAAVSVFRRSTLAELAPDGGGFFAVHEVLGRASRRGIPVAEAPVSCSPLPDGAVPGTWRDLARGVGACATFWWSRLQFPGQMPAPAPAGSWLFGLALAVVAALLLFCRLNHPLVDPDEGRHAEIPREMLAHHDLVLPRFEGLPYYEKPPLQYWLTAGAYSAFGLCPRSARLVPAAAAWLSILLTWFWARRALGERAAALGATVLCLSVGFLGLGRTVVLDSLLAVCVAGAWYAAHTAVRRPDLRWRWWLGSALVCGLGILAKGPVAVMLLLPPVLAYQCLTVTAARPRWRAWAAYLAVAASVAAPWYAVMAVRQEGYLKHFLWRDNVLRFVRPFDHQRPLWFYLPVLFAATFPWSMLWPALTYFLASRNPRLVRLRTPALGFAALAAAWCVAFFSLSGCKSPPYLAPALPPLALLVGACLEAVLLRKPGFRSAFLGHVRQALPRWATAKVLLVAGVCYLVLAWCRWADRTVALAEMALALAAAGLWFYLGRRARPALAWAACAAATLGLVALGGHDLVMGFIVRHSPAAVIGWSRTWPHSDECPVVSYGREWPSVCFYLHRDHIPCYFENFLGELVGVVKKEPKVLVVVETDALLKRFLAALPDTRKATVTRPPKPGQPILVLVQQR